jgi:hypothetical protein
MDDKPNKELIRFINLDMDLYPAIRVGERHVNITEFEISCSDDVGWKEANEQILSQLWSRIVLVSNEARKEPSLKNRRYIVTYRYGTDVDHSTIHCPIKKLYVGYYSVTAIPLEHNNANTDS